MPAALDLPGQKFGKPSAVSAHRSLPLPTTDQPIGEWPALPPNFWRSYITPRIVECAWTYHDRGIGYNATGMWATRGGR